MINKNAYYPSSKSLACVHTHQFSAFLLKCAGMALMHQAVHLVGSIFMSAIPVNRSGLVDLLSLREPVRLHPFVCL